MDDSRWHILRVKPGQEDAVASVCGVPAYVPRQRVTKFNRKMRKVASYFVPLLPGIVFVLIGRLDEMRWLPQKSAFGLLRNGDRSPATLTQKAFLALRAVEDEARVEKAHEKAPVRQLPKVGDQTAVVLAMFSDAVAALIEEIKGNKVILRVINSHLRVETTLAKLA